MAQRIYIKVVGFSEEERHALNTLFRLSEQCLTMYQLWSPQARAPAGMALLDGESYEARLEAESPLSSGMKLLWIGEDPPTQVWRSIPRPFQWPDVIEAMDTVFHPAAVDLDLDVTKDDAQDSLPPLPAKLALIVSPSRDERLYLRARLSLAHLTQADEAEGGVEALQLARSKQYDFALVDFRVQDMEPWDLLKLLRQGKRPIQHVALTKAQRSLPEHVRAWLGGADALLDSPPHPRRLNAWLRRL
jgi:CheY-like chemotaxis protein